jgi:uncharacterized protein YecT (DUF1311 family)
MRRMMQRTLGEATMPMTFAFVLTIALLFFGIFASARKTKGGAGGAPQKGPCDAAATQLELNQCYGEQFRKADAHLNSVYANLLKQMQSEAAIQKLKVAEKAWIHYRDLHCEAARYEYEGGSISPMVWAQCMATTTEHRIEELKAAYENGERKLE